MSKNNVKTQMVIYFTAICIFKKKQLIVIFPHEKKTKLRTYYIYIESFKRCRPYILILFNQVTKCSNKKDGYPLRYSMIQTFMQNNI